jgi:putative ABC transport system permease protein
MVAAEAALGGIAAAALGAVLGGGIGVLALEALGFPRSLPPFGQLAVLAAGVVLVAVLAATAPAARAARVTPIHALAST